MNRLSRTVARLRQERERGAATVEYVGIIIAVAALIVVLLVALPSSGTSLAERAKTVICDITGSGCGSGDHGADDGGRGDGSGDQGADGGQGDGGDDGSGDPAQPPRADVPDGLDPASDLVATMQSTERGREVLQWLADHGIKVVIDPDAKGAYWDGTQIVMGPGFDDASVLVHEANHARYSTEGRAADVNALSRADYVKAQVAEETDGVVQQIQAAREFRAAGHTVPDQPGEAAYDNAYRDAKANGASDADARRAGYDAVEQEFYNGGFVTSTDGKSYPDYYGGYWDDVH